MDPRYSAEAESYREKIQAFLSEHLPPGWSGIRDLEGAARETWVREWRQLLVEHGLIAPAWPKEYGGGGLSAIERVVLHEEFAKAAVPTGGPNDGFSLSMIGPTLMVMGTEEQKRHYLPRILNGTDRWCQGYSEPNSGSDLASLATQAVLDGDEWIINGQKLQAPSGTLSPPPLSHRVQCESGSGESNRRRLAGNSPGVVPGHPPSIGLQRHARALASLWAR